MTIIKMQAARAENLGGEIKLSAPVADNLTTEEILCPGIHLFGYRFGDFEKKRVAGNGQFEADLVVEGAE